MFGIDDSDIRKLEGDLLLMRETAMPYAIKSTLNMVAFAAQKRSRERLSRQFILRNHWTRSSIQVDRAIGTSVPRMQSSVGSVAHYMEKQEYGDSVNRSEKSRVGHPIPTPFASGETAIPRRRLPKGMRRRSNVRLSRSATSFANSRQRNVVAVKQAAKAGRKHVFLRDVGPKRTKGIFLLRGNLANGRDARPKLLYDLTRRTVRTPAQPWLRPAATWAWQEMRVPAYRESLLFQIHRLGMFRY